jgi:hypothetical protein
MKGLSYENGTGTEESENSWSKIFEDKKARPYTRNPDGGTLYALLRECQRPVLTTAVLL